jgi:uncharacterized protein (TIGR02265 family)
VVRCSVPRDTLDLGKLDGQFVEPPWSDPLDAEREIEAIPPGAQIRGMFIAPVAAEAKRLAPGVVKMRDRYVAFQFYPLREHARLLVDACRALYTDQPLRSGLRKLGRGAPVAFIASTLGKVVLGSALGVRDSAAALAKAYGLSLHPGRADVTECTNPNQLIVSLDEVYYFVDCHHVGAFEGAMKHAGVRGQVRMRKRGAFSADLLLEW